MDSTIPGKQLCERCHSLAALPNIEGNEIFVVNSPQVPKLDNRRASVALGESLVELRKIHAHKQNQPRGISKCRGSGLSIGKQRRVYRASLDSCIAAPDGGYGWVIVAAGFVSIFVANGYCYSFAVYFVEFLEVFGESKSMTSWIGSILNSMAYIIAPTAAGLVAKYGVRSVTLSGCLIAGLGSILSIFCTSVQLLMVTMGFLGGMGAGMMYSVAFIPIAFYFDKKQSVAMAIASSGGGVATICYPLLSKWLIEVYGWRGSLLISTGVLLHCLPFGALMKPLNKGRKPPTSKVTKNTMPTAGKEKGKLTSAQHTILQEVVQRELAEKTSALDVDYGDRINGGEMIEGDRYEDSEAVFTRNEKINQNVWHIPSNIKCEFVKGQKKTDDTFALSLTVSCDSANSRLEDDRQGVMAPSIDKHRVNSSREAFQKMLDIIDITFLCNPVFMLYLVILSTSSAGLLTALTFLTDFGISIGMTQRLSTMMFMIVGLASILARLVLGRLLDNPRRDPFIVNGIFFAFSGLITGFCSMMTLPPVLLCYSAILGVASGVYSILIPVLVVDLVGVDHMRSAMGLAVFISGIAVLLVVPVAGWLSDITQSYSSTFGLAGGLFFVSGILSLMLRSIARCIYKHREPE